MVSPPVHYQALWATRPHAFNMGRVLWDSELESTLRVKALRNPRLRSMGPYWLLTSQSCPPSAGIGWGTYRSWMRMTGGRFGIFHSPLWSQPGTNWFNTILYTEFTTHPTGCTRCSPTYSPACWRCSYQPRDFFHIFWACPAIVHYWKEVLQVITRVTKISVPYDPKHCLLGLVEQMSMLRARKILICHMTIIPLSDSGRA